jgi:hypothetical protein
MGGEYPRRNWWIEGRARVMRADDVNTGAVQSFPVTGEIRIRDDQCSCRREHRLHWLVAEAVRDDRGDVL